MKKAKKKKSKKNKNKRNQNARAVASNVNRTEVEKCNDFYSNTKYLPDSFADIDMARTFAENYSCKAKYLGRDNWLCFNGVCWVSGNGMVKRLVHQFLDGLEKEIVRANKLHKAVPPADLAYCAYSPMRVNEQQLRSSLKAAAILKEAAPYMEANADDFNAKPFLLNTPDGTYNLKKGLGKPQEHRAEDLITMATSVSPGTQGMGIWKDALNAFFCGNQELIEYMQQVMGLACVGEVAREELIIALGNGGNGKSTFFNALRQVLGDYATSMTSDLIFDIKNFNVDQVMSRLQGKRLVILSEPRKGAKMDDGLLKRIVSADQLFANPKYKDSLSFTSSHTMVLPCNRFPKLSATDYGTERRIKVVPFFAKFRENKKDGEETDDKKYTAYLVENAGGAILSWLIVGAQKAIANSYKIKEPRAVKELTESYLNTINWLKAFLEDCCVEDCAAKTTSKVLYDKYQAFARLNGYEVVSHKAFSSELQEYGFERCRDSNDRYFKGIRLKEDQHFNGLPLGVAEDSDPDELEPADNSGEAPKNPDPLDGDANPYFDTLI